MSYFSSLQWELLTTNTLLHSSFSAFTSFSFVEEIFRALCLKKSIRFLMGLKIGGKIEKINGKEISYKAFVERYLEKNQAVVLTGLMDGWRACSDWVTEDGKPNLHFLSSHFGKSSVQVAECGKREFTDQKRVEMSVSEFIDHWLEFSSQKFSNPSGCESSDQSPLYLKDWHFVKEYPDYVAYTTPLFFRDDWLNLYLDSYSMHMDPDSSQDKNEINCSDYRFVYMGSKGTWTPLHADVFRSYSWSANVCGRKQWHFLSPSQCHLVFDRHMKNSVYDIFDDVSETKFPGFKKAIWLECVQEQNEIIFVPSGWYHQVHNMEDTISINHNWFNGYNLSWVWKLLLKDYNEAKEYIEDVRDICDDFEGLCQRNLAANTGMNFHDFFIFIMRFTLAIMAQLYLLVKDSGNDILDTFPIAQNLISSLTSIKKVALNMNTVESFRGKNSRSISDDFSEILKDPDFMKLCMGLHGMIDEQWKQSCNIAVDFENYLCLTTEHKVISSPDDLIRVIDSVVTNLCTNYSDVNCSSFLAEQDELTAFNPVL